MRQGHRPRCRSIIASGTHRIRNATPSLQVTRGYLTVPITSGFFRFDYLTRLGSGDDAFEIGILAALQFTLLALDGALGAAMFLILLLLLA